MEIEMKKIRAVGARLGAMSIVGLVFVFLTAILAQRATAQVPLIASKVDVGWKHSCAIESPSGQLHCWGGNTWDQLNLSGIVTPPYFNYNFAKPTNNPAGSVAGLGLGGHRTCVKEASGALKCWGFNLFGSTGKATSEPPSLGATWNPYGNGFGGTKVPHQVVFPSGFTFGAAGMGNEHSCVVRTGGLAVTGEVWCWGLNSVFGQWNVSTPPTQSGQLGSPTGIINYNSAFNRYGTHLPQKVAGGALPPNTKMSQVGAAGYTTCSIESAPNAGQVWCWGQLGGGVHLPLKAKKQVNTANFVDAKSMQSSQTATCVIDSADKVFCAAHSLNGSLFLEVVGLPPTKKTAPGWMYGCALTTTGDVWCWGRNDYGMLGNHPTPMSNANHPPAPVPGMTGIVDVTAFFGHTCAQKSDGKLWCWGQNDSGQLGNCSFTPLSAGGVNKPVQVYKSCGTTPSPVNGTCGTSSGQPFNTAPTSNLCATGTPPSTLAPITSGGQVTGWNWTCAGTGTGSNSPICNAYVKGVCGPNNGTSVLNLPSNSTGLCSSGLPATNFTPTGTGWTWTCPGGNNAANTDDVQCGATRAQQIPPGKCGSADNAGPFASLAAVTAAGLCATGTPTLLNNTASPGNWTWSCSGSPAASCTAKDSSPPVCGTANLGTYAWNGAPALSALCAPPHAASPLTPPNGQNTALPNTYTWSCTNPSGQSIACLAKRTPPQPTTVTVTPVGAKGCWISPNVPLTITSGSTATFTVGTGPGWVVSSVVSSCGGTRVGNIFTTNPTSTNCTVTVACAPCVGVGCQSN